MLISKPENTPLLRISQPTRQNWRVGQILQATIVSSNKQGQTILDISGARLNSSLNLDRSLQQGEKIQLEVIKTGIPALLKLVNSTLPRELMVIHALRRLLPKQIPMENLLNGLPQLTNTISVTPAAHQMIARLLTTIPQFKQLTSGKGLVKALQDSGMFLENKLAQSPSGSLNQDFKAALLQLLSVLKGSPDNTVLQLESVLARLQVNQLNTISSHQAEWFIELPVQSGAEQKINIFKLRIKRNKSTGKDSHSSWSLSLDFELQTLGPVQANITLIGEHRISVGIWAQQENSAKQFEAYEDMLRRGLADAKLIVLNISCHQGEFPHSTTPEDDSKQKLLDLKV